MYERKQQCAAPPAQTSSEEPTVEAAFGDMIETNPRERAGQGLGKSVFLVQRAAVCVTMSDSAQADLRAELERVNQWLDKVVAELERVDVANAALRAELQKVNQRLATVEAAATADRKNWKDNQDLDGENPARPLATPQPPPVQLSPFSPTHPSPPSFHPPLAPHPSNEDRMQKGY